MKGMIRLIARRPKSRLVQKLLKRKPGLFKKDEPGSPPKKSPVSDEKPVEPTIKPEVVTTPPETPGEDTKPETTTLDEPEVSTSTIPLEPVEAVRFTKKELDAKHVSDLNDIIEEKKWDIDLSLNKKNKIDAILKVQ